MPRMHSSYDIRSGLHVPVRAGEYPCLLWGSLLPCAWELGSRVAGRITVDRRGRVGSVQALQGARKAEQRR